jgi:hypothetical protein
MSKPPHECHDMYLYMNRLPFPFKDMGLAQVVHDCFNEVLEVYTDRALLEGVA